MSSPDRLSPRRRILEAALQVFARDGYDAGSLNDVATAAGMSRPNLLYYYPSKRDLLVALLDARDEKLDARIRWTESAATLMLDDFIDQLSELLPSIYADRDLVMLYHRLSAEAANPAHPAHSWVLARQRRVRQSVESVLQAAVERSELPEGTDPVGLATALLGATEGIEVQWLVDPELDWKRASAALSSLVRSLMTGARATAT